ncbi:MAG: cytochrome c-type biogenesis protein [Acidobacteriota bacterium]
MISLMIAVAAPLSGQEPDGQALAQADPLTVVGPPRAGHLSGRALDTRTEEVSALLRCPVCQGLSVADSPSDMSVKMKAQVKEMLAQGYRQEQILAYFEHSYGEFVLLSPPLRGVNWVVWFAPLLGLAGGAAVLAWAFRRKPFAAKVQAVETSAPRDGSERLPGPHTLPGDPKLASYVLQVREMADGPRAGPSAGGRVLRNGDFPADGNHGG